MPVTSSGYPNPSAAVSAISSSTLASRWRRMSVDSGCGEDDVDDLDEDERGDDPADPVDDPVAAQDRGAVQRAELHPAQRQGDQRRDDQGVVDHRGQDRGMR